MLNAIPFRRTVIHAGLWVLVLVLSGCGSGGGDTTPTPTPVPSMFTVSGTLSVGEGQAVDGDTNDPNDPILDNSFASGGQVVGIPNNIGGYANNTTDQFDFYRVSLQGPITIVLSIADPQAGDLDLFVTDLAGQLLHQSIGTGSLELIDTDPNATGEFLIAVHAFTGASNYVLSIGVSSATAALRQALADDPGYIPAQAEFVLDEMIVKPRVEPGPTPDATLNATLSSLSTTYGLIPKAYSPGGPILMDASEVPTSTFTTLRARQTQPLSLRYKSEEEAARAETLAVIKTLRRDARFEYVEPNYIYHPTAIPNDEFYSFQWHYPLMNLPQAWDITQGSDDVVVAVIDTGVVTTHPDLSDRMLRDAGGTVIGFDFISDARRARDGDGIDNNPFDAGDLVRGGRSSFHGTHVSGTVAATSDNGTGVAGVTWSGKIMPLRVLGQGGGTGFDIAQAILYAAGAPNISGTVPAVTADVMNLSLGPGNRNCQALPGLDQTTADALAAAQQAGVVVVIASGNDNCDVPSPMSTFDGVINVSAVDFNKQKAPYSNFGNTIDVAAPGGDASADRDGNGVPDGVLSTMADDSGFNLRATFDISQGTSMAAPHMAGVVALMLAVNPSLTPTDINMLIAGTHADPNAGPITQDLGSPGWDPIFGYGMIDALLAVNVASSITGGAGGAPLPPNTPVLSLSATQLSFGAITNSIPLTISNVGTDDLTISDIQADVPWVEISGVTAPFTLTTTAREVLTLSVNRSGLVDGTYFGTLSLTSNGGNQAIRLVLVVQSNVVGGDVGTVFVLAIDPNTLETVAQAVTNAAAGYQYDSPGVVSQQYVIVAGTDRNNDGFICDAGEACGIFPLTDSPMPLEVNRDEQGINFPVSYDFTALGSTAQAQGVGHGSLGLTRFKRLD